MIIFGTNSTLIATDTIADKCLNCENQCSVQLNVYQRYAHVFWIPFLPAGKVGIAQCTNCQSVSEKFQFTQNLSENYEIIKSNSKTPIWTFAGAVILAALIVWAIVYSKQNDANNAQIILTPQKGDVYEVKIDSEHYTLYKVDKVVGDSVFLLMNRYETNKATGLSDLEEKGYQEEVLPLIKKNLKNMLEKGEIINIKRNN